MMTRCACWFWWVHVYLTIFVAGTEVRDTRVVSSTSRVAMKLYESTNLPSSEIYALNALYNATDGESWHWSGSGAEWNFAPSCNPCAELWQGVTCTTTPATDGFLHVTTLNLIGTGLNGYLPEEMGDFPYIQKIELNQNKLFGTIPSSMGNLTDLTVLEMGTNLLSGTIPPSVCSLPHLIGLDFRVNQLSGPLPTFGPNTKLLALVLAANHFSGTIPTSYADQSSILLLDLGNNMLTGTLPGSILSQLHALISLLLHQNAFTGTIPNLSALSNLDALGLFANQISGPIPSFFSHTYLPKLRYLVLFSNSLTGTIPLTLCTLSAMHSLQLQNNSLSGTLPPHLANMTITSALSLGDNYFTGSIPVQMYSLHLLEQLSLYSNYITGTIAEEVGQLTNLKTLDLIRTDLTGTLPAAITRLQHLKVFKLSEVNMVGPLPQNLGNMTALTYFSVHDSLFTSTIPTSLTEVPALDSLFLSSNFLTGPVALLSNLSEYISVVHLGSNGLTGQIPAGLFLHPQLTTVILGDNCFEGSLPDTVCNATNAVTFSLDGLTSGAACRARIWPGVLDAYILSDSIEGGIPDCVFHLPLLETLHLSGNNLAGTLPENAEFGPYLIDLALSHNQLSGSIPKIFQQRMWYNLDLSYNRLQGTLRGDFGTQVTLNSTIIPTTTAPAAGQSAADTATEPNNAANAVSLRNNRLSNTIPSAIQTMLNVSVLKGNLFDCAQDQHDVPQHDSGKDTTSCGSNEFNAPFYAYLGVVVAVVCAVVLLYVMRDNGHHVVQTARKWAERMVQYVTIGSRCPVDPISGQSTLAHFNYVTAALVELCTIAAWATLLMVVVEVPVYAALSHAYGTHTYTYAYSVAAAYLSGVGALVVMLLVLCGLAVVLAWLCIRSLAKLQLLERTLPSTTTAAAPPHADSHSDGNGGVGGGNGVHATSTGTQNPWGFSTCIYAVVFILNTGIVGGTNVAFVLATIYASSGVRTFAQIALSLFKLAWANYGLAYLLDWAQERLESGHDKERRSTGKAEQAVAAQLFGLELAIQLFNNIAVPCVAVALLSPDCFNSAISAEDAVTTTFTFHTCEVFTGNDCSKSGPDQQATSTYLPPFTYSYQCSASLITYYAPTFVYMGLVVTFQDPLVSYVKRTLYRTLAAAPKWQELLRTVVPQILRPYHEVDAALAEPFEASKLCVTVLSFLGILLTFGCVFPPLAVVMLTAIVSTVARARMEVGRYLSEALAANAHHYCDAVNEQCVGVGSVPKLAQAARVLAVAMFSFYALFLFDTLGDALGALRAFWILIVVPLLPVMVFFVHAVWVHWKGDNHPGRGGGKQQKTSQEQIVEGVGEVELKTVVLSPLQGAAAAAVVVNGHVAAGATEAAV